MVPANDLGTCTCLLMVLHGVRPSSRIQLCRECQIDKGNGTKLPGTGICGKSAFDLFTGFADNLSAYTIVESTTHSVAVDILTSPSADIGTLFISSGEGTYFVEALADTNRNEYGIVDFEQLVGLEVGKVTASE